MEGTTVTLATAQRIAREIVAAPLTTRPTYATRLAALKSEGTPATVTGGAL